MAEPPKNSTSDRANVVHIDRPMAIAHNVAYTAAEEPKNPIVSGLPLRILSQLVANSGFVQQLLWSNAGLDKLRNLPELEGVTPRYDPTVIISNGIAATTTEDNDDFTALLTEDFHSRKPISKLFPSVLDYHEAYKSGKLTPTAIAETILPLIRRDVENPTRHATAFLDSRVDLVLQAARESTERYAAGRPLSPLDGVPMCVKDEVDLGGYKKHFGSKLDFTREGGATTYCVEQWLKAGAVIVGKTNMQEFGLDTANNNPNYGTPLNPYNSAYYCGGSSGGSAYAVAAGLVPIALGADGGGSVRLPSSYCGLFGLKTSHSRVSGRPSPALAASVGVYGPMTANMVDLELAYRIMAQPDPGNPVAALFQAPAASTALTNRKKVLGIFKPWFERSTPEVQKACNDLITYLTESQDYEIVPITLPYLPQAQLAHAMTILSEVCTSITSATGTTSPLVSASNRVLMGTGSKTTSMDFLQAQKVRTLMMQHLSHLFTQHPGLVIVTPTTPDAGWAIGPGHLKYGVSDGNRSIRNMWYVGLANFTGCPAISVPAGYVDGVVGEGKVPVGLMGMAEWCCDDELVAFGYDCEKWLGEGGLEGGRVRPETWVDVLKLAREREGGVDA